MMAQRRIDGKRKFFPFQDSGEIDYKALEKWSKGGDVHGSYTSQAPSRET